MSTAEFLAELRLEKRHLLAEPPIELEASEMSLHISPNLEQDGIIPLGDIPVCAAPTILIPAR